MYDFYRNIVMYFKCLSLCIRIAYVYAILILYFGVIFIFHESIFKNELNPGYLKSRPGSLVKALLLIFLCFKICVLLFLFMLLNTK